MILTVGKSNRCKRGMISVQQLHCKWHEVIIEGGKENNGNQSTIKKVMLASQKNNIKGIKNIRKYLFKNLKCISKLLKGQILQDLIQ